MSDIVNNPLQPKKKLRSIADLEATPMFGSSTFNALKEYQDRIRRLHRNYLKATDPKIKNMFAKHRDRLINRIKQESLESFIESVNHFNSVTLESDSELRDLRRRFREAPTGATKEKLHAALKRAGLRPSQDEKMNLLGKRVIKLDKLNANGSRQQQIVDILSREDTKRDIENPQEHGPSNIKRFKKELVHYTRAAKLSRAQAKVANKIKRSGGYPERPTPDSIRLNRLKGLRDRALLHALDVDKRQPLGRSRLNTIDRIRYGRSSQDYPGASTRERKRGEVYESDEDRRQMSRDPLSTSAEHRKHYRLNVKPDMNAHNAPEQLHTWKRYMSKGNRLSKLFHMPNRPEQREVTGRIERARDKTPHDIIDRHANPYGQFSRAIIDDPGLKGYRVSGFERARDRYIKAAQAGRRKPSLEMIESDEELRNLEKTAATGDPSDKQRYYSALHRYPDRLKEHLTKLAHNYVKTQGEHYNASDNYSNVGRAHPYDSERKQEADKRLKKAAYEFSLANGSLHDATNHINNLTKSQHHPGHFLYRGQLDPEEHLKALIRMHGLRDHKFFTKNKQRRLSAEQLQSHTVPFGFSGVKHFIDHVKHHYGVTPSTRLSNGYTQRISMGIPDKSKDPIKESDEEMRRAERKAKAGPSDEKAKMKLAALNFRLKGRSTASLDRGRALGDWRRENLRNRTPGGFFSSPTSVGLRNFTAQARSKAKDYELGSRAIANSVLNPDIAKAHKDAALVYKRASKLWGKLGQHVKKSGEYDTKARRLHVLARRSELQGHDRVSQTPRGKSWKASAPGYPYSLASQISQTEADENLRKIGRELSNDPIARERHVANMVRAGRGSEVLNPRKQQPIVRSRSSADIHDQLMRNYDRSIKLRPDYATELADRLQDPERDTKDRRDMRKEFIRERFKLRADADSGRHHNRPDIEIPARRALKLARAASKHLKLLPHKGVGDERLNRFRDLMTRSSFQALERSAMPERKRGTSYNRLAADYARHNIYPNLKRAKWQRPKEKS